MRKILVLILSLALTYGCSQTTAVDSSLEISASSTKGGEEVLVDAFENKRSNVQVESQGIVIKVLSDDIEGSKHQRFIVRIDSGQTILIAHNIDIAPRINSLKKGDAIAFYGEYEWNSQGGIVHWTHHDPRGRHVDGWIEHNGKKYQ